MSSTPSPPQTPQRTARRSSRFIEGEYITYPNLRDSSSSNELLAHILSEMDEFERKRKTSTSNSNPNNSSVESLPSPNASTTMTTISSQEAVATSPDRSSSFSSVDDKERFRDARASLDDEKTRSPQGEEKSTTRLRGRFFRAWMTKSKD